MSAEAAIRGELITLYRNTPCMAMMIRLGWHDAGTYDCTTNSGGANGSIRFDPEISHGANAGLPKAIELLAPMAEKYPNFGTADLYQLASVVAVEFCGGPKIPFRSGRVDATGSDKCTDDGRLPDATKTENHLRDIFYRMGFVDKDIVALSGAHTLGRAHSDRSGFEGAWTKDPFCFDNSYFKELLAKDADPSLLKLPSDICLLDTPSMRRWVETYAEDEARFFADYAQAHSKLSELGQFQ